MSSISSSSHQRPVPSTTPSNTTQASQNTSEAQRAPDNNTQAAQQSESTSEAAQSPDNGPNDQSEVQQAPESSFSPGAGLFSDKTTTVSPEEASKAALENLKAITEARNQRRLNQLDQQDLSRQRQNYLP